MPVSPMNFHNLLEGMRALLGSMTRRPCQWIIKERSVCGFAPKNSHVCTWIYVKWEVTSLSPPSLPPSLPQYVRAEINLDEYFLRLLPALASFLNTPEAIAWEETGILSVHVGNPSTPSLPPSLPPSFPSFLPTQFFHVIAFIRLCPLAPFLPPSLLLPPLLSSINTAYDQTCSFLPPGKPPLEKLSGMAPFSPSLPPSWLPNPSFPLMYFRLTSLPPASFLTPCHLSSPSISQWTAESLKEFLLDNLHEEDDEEEATRPGKRARDEL